MPTFQVSIPEEISRVIYDLTEKSQGTVPGWIRDAALERLAALGYRTCTVCGRFKTPKSFNGGGKVCRLCIRKGRVSTETDKSGG